MMKMDTLSWIAFILLAIGGLNWGLYGIWEFDLVAWLFGELTTLSKIIYILVGVAALYKIYVVFAKTKE